MPFAPVAAAAFAATCHACAGRRALWQFAAVAIACVALGIVLEYSGFDLWIGSVFHDAATGAWPYRHDRLFESVLYDGGNLVTRTLYGALLCALVASMLVPAWARWRRALLYLAVAGATGPIIVALLKSGTHIYVPWRLSLFGGDLPYVRLCDAAPPGLGPGHAFPGGHSSGAFAWLSIYFLLRAGNHPWRVPVLRTVLAAGIVFAATQSARGAHFPSHDVFTLAICWLASAIWARLFFPAAFARGA